MATIGTLTNFSDVAKRLDPEGKVDKIIELLSEQNEILMDSVAVEANGTLKHLTTVRTGLPTTTWRQLNYGVQPSKSKTKQVHDAMGMLEAYAQVDKKLAEINGNTAAFRLSEDMAFLEGMNQEMADTFIYGNTSVDEEKYLGLALRYNALTGAASSGNVISAGGAGSDNTSIYLVIWGPLTAHFIYPKGSKAGLQHEDLGQETVTDAAGGLYQALRTHYSWDVGLTVRDWRAVCRICNIDVSELNKTATGNSADIIDLMVRAKNKCRKTIKLGRPVFYVNETIMGMLERQLMNKSTAALSLKEIMGEEVMTFRGIPIRQVDSITDAEATVA